MCMGNRDCTLEWPRSYQHTMNSNNIYITFLRVWTVQLMIYPIISACRHKTECNRMRVSEPLDYRRNLTRAQDEYVGRCIRIRRFACKH